MVRGHQRFFFIKTTKLQEKQIIIPIVRTKDI